MSDDTNETEEKNEPFTQPVATASPVMTTSSVAYRSMVGADGFWPAILNATRVLCQLAAGQVARAHTPDIVEVELARVARRDLDDALIAMEFAGGGVGVAGGPMSALTDEGVKEREDQAMMYAAMVAGYNTFVEGAETLGERVQFRLLREQCFRQLQATGSKRWLVEPVTEIAKPAAGAGEKEPADGQ